jgi:TrmH family RNA methyltransferase
MKPPFDAYEVCLVRTSSPENLGSVARIMGNFGFRRLALVAPEVDPADARAMVVARRARALLAAARVVPSLEEAVAGASLVVGTTARRGTQRPTMTPRALLAEMAARGPARVALVFGPEDSGLSGAEVDLCDLLCGIPTRGALRALNLAQAVAVVLWEISQADVPPTDPDALLASRSEIEGLLDHACRVLEEIGYFKDQPRARVRVHLRRMLTSARLRSDQVRTLRGVCRQALWALGRVGEG